MTLLAFVSERKKRKLVHKVPKSCKAKPGMLVRKLKADCYVDSAARDLGADRPCPYQVLLQKLLLNIACD